LTVAFGPSPWMKKAVVLGYVRISDEKQDKSDRDITEAIKKPVIIAQMKELSEGLKRPQLPKVKEWFAEVGSGTRRDRPQWTALKARAIELADQGKRVFIAIKDPSRWARNTRHSFSALDILHDYGVPVYATREGIQTGSVGDLHPTEELLFMQLQGGASYVSQEQKKKADKSVEISKEEGIMSGKGTSLYPFARKDVLESFLLQLPLIAVPKKEGGGADVFKFTVAGDTAPHGISPSAVVRMRKAEVLRRKHLDEREYEEWRQYRNRIRSHLIVAEYDPYARTTKAGDLSRAAFGVKALLRMTGRYLTEPWKYSRRSDDEIEEFISNPRPYLSVKDSDLWKSFVGKKRR